MLSPSDASVVARDPSLPALSVLLDADELSALLNARVHRQYLRYKPGTSCVLGCRVLTDTGTRDVMVTAYEDAGALKIDKTVSEAPRGAVLHVDRARGLLAVLAAGDRDLPFLSALAREKTRRRALRALLPGRLDLAGATVETLRYKPMRRWVGLLTTGDGTRVVLRAYRTADAAAAAAVVRKLAGGPPRLPRLRGWHEDLACLAMEYVDGRPLDELLAEGEVEPKQLSEVGATLARLHTRPRGQLPLRDRANDITAVRAAADQVAALLPGHAASAQDLAEELAGRLSRQRIDLAVVHGDFSTDQVIFGPEGASLVDLDRAVVGDAASDLASLAAASAAAAAPADHQGLEVLDHITSGYAAQRRLPASESVRTHTAALLLRRVVEPFRQCEPNWEQRAIALLADATRALPTPLDSSVDDALEGLVGRPITWTVLKDKPGRRRTSRASGPAGTAIVKVYASSRAPVVARRVRALQDGPAEPAVPRTLLCDDARHLVVLTEVMGRPFRDHLLAGDTSAAARVGRSLASWHAAHRGRTPDGLRAHTAAREVEILLERCASAPGPIAEVVRSAVENAPEPWAADTIVHRDLYEDQIVVGEQVGLLDLDDAALGPAELDLGNLLAHLDLLQRRTRVDLTASRDVLLAAYADHAPLDPDLLQRCLRLSLLRLACVHRDPALLPNFAPADERALIGASRAAHHPAEG